MPPRVRVEFTDKHDKYLVKYLATYCPSKAGRSGVKIFENLVANPENKWPFAKHHTWQSWRERYVKHSRQFDAAILKFQRRKEILPMVPQKRLAEPASIEKLAANTKRARREEEEESPIKETREAIQPEQERCSSSVAKPQPRRPLEPPETPTKAPQPTREPEATHARHTSTAASPATSDANGSTFATKKPATVRTSLRTRQDTLKIPSSSPDRHVPLPIEVTYSPNRHVKRIRVRPGTPSDIFASEPPSPRADVASPVATSAYPRAPPRVVDSLHGQVLVDQRGHIPRTFPLDGEDGAEEVEDKTQWPPNRGRTTKKSSTNGLGVEHHAFSQPQSQYRPEQAKAHVVAVQVFPVLDQRTSTVAAESSDQAHQARVPEIREHKNRNGASPVKRIVKAAPPSNPHTRQTPKHLSNVFKFPAPRASTRSPFRPESSPEVPQPPPPAGTKVERHPVLSRVRRQTIGHGEVNRNGHEHEHGRHVPSVDLVALSRSSMSSRSHSRSSADASVSARRPRWSLPAYVHATPWMLDERGAPSAVHGDLWGHERIVYTPSPARSLAGTTLSAPLAGGLPTRPPASVTPHPPDLELAALHGLVSILAHMSANHGLALSVVEAVYKRVGSLREADEVLKGMREAAEGFGEREIERRVRDRRAGAERAGRPSVGRDDHRSGSGNRNGRSQLRYVVASDDGRGSEYSPPETSRAAMWKRKSESTLEKASEEEREEEAEGREVEEELRNWDDDEDDSDADHDLMEVDDEATGQDEDGDPDEEVMRSKDALLQDTRFAQELERKLGRGLYRRAVAKLFA